MGGINQIYVLSLLLKGFNALIECGFGAYLGIASSTDLDGVVHWLLSHSYFHGQGQWIAAAVFDYTASIPDATRSFFAVYLVIHGLAKALLVAGLLKKKRWAYPLAMLALSLFIIYQSYEYSALHAVGLLLLTAFDIFVLLLIFNDYRQQTAKVIANP